MRVTDDLPVPDLSACDPRREGDVATCLLGKPWGTWMLAELAIAAAQRKLPAESVLACLDAQLDGTIELLRALTRGS